MVVGHGMVGHRFVEALRSRDSAGEWRVTVLAEEADAAYDRVGLTSYTEHWDRGLLALPGNAYPGDDLVETRLGSPVRLSWTASCSSRSSAFFCSVTSTSVPTQRITSPSDPTTGRARSENQ